MLRLDHLPFYAADLDSLRRCFERLGFQVSPRGSYVTPATGERWANHGVFLDEGWFDLIADPALPSGGSFGSGSCLFLASDAAALPADARDRAYALERRWDDKAGAAEPFTILPLRGAGLPMPLAAISHASPMSDVAPSWRTHPNTAVAVSGVRFVGVLPADGLASLLDLSGFSGTSKDDFARDVGAGCRFAVKVAVRSLDAAASAIQFPCHRGDGLLRVSPAPGLPCAFEFTEIASA